MIALIDGDIVRYRTGFASNDVDEGIALWRANETMDQILRATGATEFIVFLSDRKENNFRYKLYPGYKASREKTPKPIHHEAIGRFLEKEWDARIAVGQEADDALGIAQTENFERTWVDGGPRGEWVEAVNTIGPSVICSIDKDLLQVPGRHYNWVKGEFYEQTWLEGLRSFYAQTLSGDRVDDVFGIDGIGAAKSKKALRNAESEEEMIYICRQMWDDDDKFTLAGKLLWVRRFPEEDWDWRSITQDSEAKLRSSYKPSEEKDKLLEHGLAEKSGVPEHGTPTDDTTKTLTQA